MQKLSRAERALLRKLSTPQKIQDYLDRLPFNFEKRGETLMSPRRVMRERKAHCIEGALFAYAALRFHGRKAFLLDLTVLHPDYDHVVTLFKENGYWGSISKTNHAVLRYRDPVYKTVRELALSFFHEYFLPENGKKTMKAYSRPFSLKRYGDTWITAEKELWDIGGELDASHHFKIVPFKNRKHLRAASKLERRAASIPEYRH